MIYVLFTYMIYDVVFGVFVSMISIQLIMSISILYHIARIYSEKKASFAVYDPSSISDIMLRDMNAYG